MKTEFVGFFALVALVLAVPLGRCLRGVVPGQQLDADTRDTIKLAVGLVATMAALLLGLLIYSVRVAYDTKRNEVFQLAANVSLLDRELALFGPAASEARTHLRNAVRQAVGQMWSPASEATARLTPNPGLGNAVYLAVQQLAPQDELHRDLKARALVRVQELGQVRHLLGAQAGSSMPVPLLVAVIGWLTLIFLGFGLLAPPNTISLVSLWVAAICVTGAIFLIQELDTPFSGLVQISSEPMVRALDQGVSSPTQNGP